jgi:hypothetical protein
VILNGLVPLFVAGVSQGDLWTLRRLSAKMLELCEHSRPLPLMAFEVDFREFE